MKSIFFYANFQTHDLSQGITRKVYNEIKAFQQLGYMVTYCGYLDDGVAIFDNENVVKLKNTYKCSNKKIQHIFRRWKLMKLCIKYLNSSNENYNISYVRYHFFDKTFIRLLQACKRISKKCIIEAHSTPKFSQKLSIMKFIGIIDAKYNQYAKRYVDLVASMSGENNMWGIKTIQIENAVDIETIKPHHYVGNREDINFISVSFERDVHGYDRLIKGIKQYYDKGGTRRITFRMVGSSLQSTIDLVNRLGLQDVCYFFKPMYGEQLDELYNMSNIAVGCLANHRIGSNYGSALKTKEYIAKGIPFIYGWEEKILKHFDYGLKFELSEEPIEIEKVIDFYDSLSKDLLPEKMRKILGTEDTWLYQMTKVINSVSE